MSTIPPTPPGAPSPNYGSSQQGRATNQHSGRLLLATSRHRVAALLLDTALVLVTFGIGWMIWSLIVWGKGQSPAKQILKIRIHSSETGAPATWGHVAIYEFLLPWSVALACGILNLLTFGILGSVAYVAIWVTDFCWFFKNKECRTLRDITCKTLIVNIA